MKNRLLALLVLSLATLPLAAEQTVVLSDVYPIVKKYKSMEGPQGLQTVYLGDRDKPELIWVKAIRTEVVKPDGKTPANPDLMCHMNVDIDSEKHKALFNLKRWPAARLITISQGMRTPSGAFESRLPDGFAFPMASNEPLLIMTQVLNHNIEHPKNLNVRHRVTIEWMRDSELKERPVAVFNLGAAGMVQLTDNPVAMAAMADMQADHHGPSCLIGQRAPNAVGMGSDYVDPQGKHYTGHWVVPPGKQVNANDVTWFMNLPYDTKLHYAAVHLHPYAQSLTLHDTTTDTDVFKASAKNPKGRIGLDRVDEFVSMPGVPLYKDHKYELISVYNNPTKQNADSMASMFLALDDPEFAAPTTPELVERAVVITNDTALILRTPGGDLGAMLANNSASLQLARMIATGAFRDAEAKVGESAITFTEKRSIPEWTQDGGLPVTPGAVALCRADTEVSLVVVTGPAPELGDRCTVVGKLGPGAEVVRAIIAAGTGKLVKAEVLSGPDLKSLKLAPARTIAEK